MLFAILGIGSLVSVTPIHTTAKNMSYFVVWELHFTYTVTQHTDERSQQCFNVAMPSNYLEPN
jgi:hypothetical protein